MARSSARSAALGRLLSIKLVCGAHRCPAVAPVAHHRHPHRHGRHDGHRHRHLGPHRPLRAVRRASSWLFVHGRPFVVARVHGRPCSWLPGRGCLFMVACAWLPVCDCLFMAVCLWFVIVCGGGARGFSFMVVCSWLHAFVIICGGRARGCLFMVACVHSCLVMAVCSWLPAHGCMRTIVCSWLSVHACVVMIASP